MLRLLWNYLEKKNWKIYNKHTIFLGVLMLLAGIIGFCIWLIVSLFTLKTVDWMICFIGYSMVLAFLIGYLFACNHDFT